MPLSRQMIEKMKRNKSFDIIQWNHWCNSCCLICNAVNKGSFFHRKPPPSKQILHSFVIPVRKIRKYPCFPLLEAQGVFMLCLVFISLHIKVCGSLEMRAGVFARPWLNGSSLMSVWKAACFSCGMNSFPPPKPWINGGLFFPEVVSWVDLRGLESLLPWSDRDSTWITKANTTPITITLVTQDKEVCIQVKHRVMTNMSAP